MYAPRISGTASKSKIVTQTDQLVAAAYLGSLIHQVIASEENFLLMLAVSLK